MSDPSNEIQKSIYAALTADAALTAALGGVSNVFDMPPDPRVFPYVRIGETQLLGDDTACAIAWEQIETVHIFANGPSARAVCKSIGGAVRAVLMEGALAPTGFSITERTFEDVRYRMDPDGITAHGILSVRYLVDPTA